MKKTIITYILLLFISAGSSVDCFALSSPLLLEKKVNQLTSLVSVTNSISLIQDLKKNDIHNFDIRNDMISQKKKPWAFTFAGNYVPIRKKFTKSINSLELRNKFIKLFKLFSRKKRLTIVSMTNCVQIMQDLAKDIKGLEIRNKLINPVVIPTKKEHLTIALNALFDYTKEHSIQYDDILILEKPQSVVILFEAQQIPMHFLNKLVFSYKIKSINGSFKYFSRIDNMKRKKDYIQITFPKIFLIDNTYDKWKEDFLIRHPKLICTDKQCVLLHKMLQLALCAWCNNVLDVYQLQKERSGHTHGMCPTCEARMLCELEEEYPQEEDIAPPTNRWATTRRIQKVEVSSSLMLSTKQVHTAI